MNCTTHYICDCNCLKMKKLEQRLDEQEKMLNEKWGEMVDGDWPLVKANLKIDELTERLSEAEKVIEDISKKYASWKDSGHHCQSKIDLQSITDQVRDYLKKSQFSEDKSCKGLK